MALILSIETATAVCSVCLSDGDKILGIKETSEHNSHSRVVAVFIDELLKETGVDKHKLDAVAVSKGPGSFTGLRIGVSTAKGLCYALDIPLIAVETLEAMAFGMKKLPLPKTNKLPVVYIPMIDARRMEVYASIYNNKLELQKATSAEIITSESYSNLQEVNYLMLAGDGAEKCRSVLTHPNISIIDNFSASASYLVEPANQLFEKGKFENTAYFEPFYLKDFIAGKPRVKGLE